MPEKKTSLIYKIIKSLVRLFYPKTQVVGEENLPDEPVIIVSNHAQMHGPIACELYFPGKRYIWCVGQMMHLKEVPDYAFQDFWSQKPKWCRWFYRLLSYLIAPLSVFIFNAGPSISVYRDARLMTTFKMSIDKLQSGASIIIFPEHDVPYNNIIFEFQDKFIDIARVYYKKTGTELSFVPMYIAPALKKMYLGEPIRFCADAPIKEERRRICGHLMDVITKIATALPEHTVVPYPNLPKKDYPSNIPGKAGIHEKPVVDYRNFRLKKINEPQFSHLKYLLGWVGYFILFFLTETLIPAENCYPVHCWLDDVIPFCEWFAIPYVFWYVLIVFSLVYFALYDPDSFKKLMIFIIVTQVVAMTIYIVFPNRQDLRPEMFERDNPLTRLMGFIYSVDTNTGVCPSLHVAYSIGIASTWLKYGDASKGRKAFIVAAVILICLSVAFVKQHSVVDIFAALPVCLLAEVIAFGKSYWKPKLGL